MSEETAVVYIVDDDPSICKALKRLFGSAGYEAEAFESAQQFLNFSYPDKPGCLVLDIRMPEVSGLDLQDLLAKKDISFPVIFITGHGTVPASVRAFKAGAIDFLQKPFKDSELLDVVSNGIDKHRRLLKEQREMKIIESRLEALTPREYEVFIHVASGKLNKQVAFDLCIAEKTVKVHRARVMEKIGAQSLADLVRIAEKLQICP